LEIAATGLIKSWQTLETSSEPKSASLAGACDFTCASGIGEGTGDKYSEARRCINLNQQMPLKIDLSEMGTRRKMPKQQTLASELEPGQYVMLEGADDWGLGQIQSVTGDRATVNFENMGKRLINLKHATLKVVDPAEAARTCPP
jgi:hypothetical protein